VIDAMPVKQFTYDYPERQVWFDVWKVERFKGVACGREGQEIRWVSLDELSTLNFPPANQAILQLINHKRI
jgi:8-oxo-dGTP diphosphatase